ncbi:MAG: hypothetical protein N2746_10205 [Deltaproteobacteria bacterium]|nr:hypothetical protein [Deltaproteobacteria bacterium]
MLISVGNKTVDYNVVNKPIHISLLLQYLLAKRLILDKIKAAIGYENIGVFVPGCTLFAVEINRFFHATDIAVHGGYSITEILL